MHVNLYIYATTRTEIYGSYMFRPLDQSDRALCSVQYTQKPLKSCPPSLFNNNISVFCGPGSSVGIATELRAGRSGIESRWRHIFRPSRPALGPTQLSCKMGTGSIPGVKCGRGVLLTTHPLLVPLSWKSRAIPLPTVWATPALLRDHFTFFISVFF